MSSINNYHTAAAILTQIHYDKSSTAKRHDISPESILKDFWFFYWAIFGGASKKTLEKVTADLKNLGILRGLNQLTESKPK